MHVKLNGVSTLGENIADNGGLRISYDALQTWLSEHHYDDSLLPGLNMTHVQQFFLSFAQVCFIASEPEEEPRPGGGLAYVRGLMLRYV